MPRYSASTGYKEDRSWIEILGYTLATATTVYGVYWTYDNVSKYGWDGTLRYIWEGDPYTPEFRRHNQILNSVEKSRSKEEKKTNDIEEALERARLDTVDDENDNKATTTKITTKEIVKLWIDNYSVKGGNLEKSLAGLSSNLDKLAGKVDSVIISSSSQQDSSAPKVMQDLKKRKKLLSKQLVLDMERCDALMASYQVLTKE